MRSPNDLRIQTICLMILTAIALGAAMFYLKPVLIPFVLAAFAVYCLVPLIDALTTHLRVSRPIAVAITGLLGSMLLVFLGLLIWESAQQMTDSSSLYEARFRELFEEMVERIPLEALGVNTEDLDALRQLPRQASQRMLGRVAGSIMSLLSNGLLVVIFMLFMLAGRASSAAPRASLRRQIEDQIKRYVLTKTAVSAMTGLLVGLTLALFGVRLALVFGVLTFLCNFIPSIGSVIATLLPIPLIVLSTTLTLPEKILAMAIPAAIQFAIGNIIEPRIMGRSMGLHPVVVLLGLIFFGTLWGLVGMFLATPIMAIVKIVLTHLPLAAPVARLMEGHLGPIEDQAPSPST